MSGSCSDNTLKWMQKKKKYLLIKIYPWSIIGNLQNLRRSTNQNCATNVNGHKTQQHHHDLEDVGPDHSPHATLHRNVEKRSQKCLQYFTLYKVILPLSQC